MTESHYVIFKPTMRLLPKQVQCFTAYKGYKHHALSYRVEGFRSNFSEPDTLGNSFCCYTLSLF